MSTLQGNYFVWIEMILVQQFSTKARFSLVAEGSGSFGGASIYYVRAEGEGEGVYEKRTN